MTKKVFIEKLTKRLSILTEEEKEDILNEYKVILDDKIKNGQTEAEAIADFGNFDEFVDEILSAYKINPKEAKKENTSTKEKAKTFIETGEDLIKDGAQKLTEVTDKIVTDFKQSHTEISVELVFELILKGIVALILMAALTLPFRLIFSIGESILDFSFFPFSSIFALFWRLIVSVLYFGACILLVIALFKQYVKNPSERNQKTKQSSKKSATKEKKASSKEDSKAEKKEEEKIIERENRSQNKNSSEAISNIVLLLLKIGILFVFVIPLWFCIIALFIILSVFCFLLFKGIGVIGFTLGTIGLIILLIQFTNLLYNGIFNNNKIHAYPFIIALVFIVIGSFLSFDYIANIEYIDAAPSVHYKEEAYSYNIQKPVQIYTDNYMTPEIITDNNLANNEVQVKVSYYDEHTSINKREMDSPETYNIYMNHTFQMTFKNGYNLVLDGLRKNHFYNYDKLDQMQVKVYCNEATKALILLQNN
ncbi:MAG: hypothetical protein PHN72_05520 [Bacilli bacterium]|nr:hypothetical protein [Bacilli bacterium]